MRRWMAVLSQEVGASTSVEKADRKYSRDWAAYNGACTHEVTDVKHLLGGFSDLINLIEMGLQGFRGKGRPPFPLGYAVFATVLKAYSGLPSRPLESLLNECVELGCLRNVPMCLSSGGADANAGLAQGPVRIPQFNTVCQFLRSEWLTPLLLELVTATAHPLRVMEREFAVDGTGWSTRWNERWLDHRLSTESDRQQWNKLHLVVGCKTNVVARAAVSPGSHHDHPYFRPLVTVTAKYFNVEAVLADMGYLSRSSYNMGRQLETSIRIPFKVNNLPSVDDGSAWSENLRYFEQNCDAFMAEYHKRSNVESTNSALKRVMPEKLRTRDFGAQVNEALAKLVAYNLRVLSRETRMKELHLDLRSEALLLENCVHNVVTMRRCGGLDKAT